jgi:outer membrane protein
LNTRFSTRGAGRPRRGLALPLAVLLLAGAAPAPARGYDLLNDPLNAMGGVPATPAKDLLPDAGNACQSAGPLPSPLGLADAVERALCNNPRTRQSWANVKAQAAAVGTGWSAYLPTLSGTSRFSHTDRRINFPGHGEYDTHARSYNMDLGLNLNWVLYDFGLRAANLESARQLLNAAQAAQDDTLQSVFFDTAQAFYDAQAAAALLAANREAEQAAEKSFKAAEARYAAGAGALADKLQAQTSYEQAALKRVQSEGDLQIALGNLASVMGLRPNATIRLAGAVDEAADDPLFKQALDDLIEQAVRDHPKMLAAQAQLEAAKAQVDATSAAGRPTLALVGNYDHNSVSATPINNQGSSRQGMDNQEIGLQVSVPLFEGFGRHYKVSQAQAQAESKGAELAGIGQQVSLEVWKSYQAMRTGMENLKATKTLVQSARQSFDVAQGRYKFGVGNIIELLKAQSDLSSAEQQRLLAVTRWQTSRLRLATSLGQLGMDDISPAAR